MSYKVLAQRTTHGTVHEQPASNLPLASTVARQHVDKGYNAIVVDVLNNVIVESYTGSVHCEVEHLERLYSRQVMRRIVRRSRPKHWALP